MRFRRNLMGAAALAVSLGLLTVACGSDSGSSSDTTAAVARRRPAAARPRRPAERPRRPAAQPRPAAAAPASARPAPARSRPSRPARADGEGKKVGLLFDVTGRGDKSFNDAAAAGARQGQGRLRHGRHRGVGADRGRRQRPARAHQGVRRRQDLIVAVGFLWGDAVTASAAENPNQKYAIVDSVVNTPEQGSTTNAPNVRSMVFAEQRGLVPRRRGRRLRVEVRQARLHRRRRERPHQEVRGRLHRRRQGRQP